MEPLFWKPYKMICLINFVFGLLKTSSLGININSWLHFLRNVSNNKNALFHSWKRWVHCESCFQIIILIAAAFTLQNFVRCICSTEILYPHYRHTALLQPEALQMRKFVGYTGGGGSWWYYPKSNSKTQLEGQLYHRLRHWLVVTHVQFTRMISW